MSEIDLAVHAKAARSSSANDRLEERRICPRRLLLVENSMHGHSCLDDIVGPVEPRSPPCLVMAGYGEVTLARRVLLCVLKRLRVVRVPMSNR